MKLDKRLSFNHAILVRPDDLARLDSFLKRHFKQIKYSAKCEDGTEMEAPAIEEILAYENPDFRRLKSIEITATDDKLFGEKAEVELGGGGFLLDATSGARIAVEDFDKQSLIETEIRSRLKMTRPWYSPVTRVSFAWLLPLFMLALSLLLNLYDLLAIITEWWRPIIPQSSPSSPRSETLAIIVYGSLAFTGYLIDRSKAFVFPRVFFLIGRQETTFANRQRIAYLIFAVIGLGILVNIISSWLLH